MKGTDSSMREAGRFTGWGRGLALVAAMIAAGGLAACQSSSGGGPTADPAAAAAANAEAQQSRGIFGPKPTPNKGVAVVGTSNGIVRPDGTYDPSIFAKTGYCPPVQVRVGAQSYQAFEKKHDNDPQYIRYQGSIDTTARECQNVADKLVIKLGVAGRVIGGPKAAAGAVDLPMRVAVVRQHDAQVLLSQAFKAGTQIAPPDFSGSFSQVIDNIQVTVAPTDRDLIIYVGFDDGGPKKNTPTG